MQTAKELDSGKIHRNICYKLIQDEVKEEVADIEDRQVEKLFRFTECFLPKPENIKQNQEVEKNFNDREIFSMIMRAVSEQSGEPIDKIKRHRRFRDIWIPRGIVIFLTRFATDLSMNEVGRLVVNGIKLDHSTIFHACNRIKNAIDTRESRTHQLFLNVVAQLNDQGVYINLKYNQPEWYRRLLKRQEKKELNLANKE